VADDGKIAITHYEVIEEYENFSYLKLNLETGRTHQIRVHLAHISHPVLCDPTYGGRRIVYGMATSNFKAFINNILEISPYQLLHARTLGFVHPETKQFIKFDSKLPNTFLDILEKVKNYSENNVKIRNS
jgi:23S rRNA pseudouridine1911/1915/1917 synthase